MKKTGNGDASIKHTNTDFDSTPNNRMASKTDQDKNRNGTHLKNEATSVKNGTKTSSMDFNSEENRMDEKPVSEDKALLSGSAGEYSMDVLGEKTEGEEPEEEASLPAEEEEAYPGLPVDRGWAWVMMVVQFVLTFLAVGYGRALSMLFMEFIDLFHVTATEATVAFALMAAFFGIGNMVVSHVLAPRMGGRTIVLIGSTMCTVAMAATSLAPNMIFVSVTHCFVGFSHALMYIPSITLLGYYFNKRRSRAMAVANAGLSVSALVFPPLTQHLITSFGARGALLLLAGFQAQAIVAACLLRPVSYYVKAAAARAAKAKGSEDGVDGDVCVSVEEVSSSSRKDVALRLSEKENVSVSRKNLALQLSEMEGVSLSRKDVSFLSSEKENVSLSRKVMTLQAMEDKGDLPEAETALLKDYDDTHVVSRSPELSSSHAVFPSYLIGASENSTSLSCSAPNRYASEEFLNNARNLDITLQTDTNGIPATARTSSRTTNIYQRQQSCPAPHQSVLSHRRAVNVTKATTPSLAKNSPFFRSSLMDVCGSTVSIPTSLVLQRTNSSREEDGAEGKGREEGEEEGEGSEEGGEPDCWCLRCLKATSNIFDVSLFQNWLFRLIVAYLPLGLTGGFIGFYLPSLGVDNGLTPSDAALLMTVAGPVDLVSRLTLGYLADLEKVKRTHLVAACLFLTGLASQFCKFYTNFYLLAAYAVMFGLFGGACQNLLVVVLIDLLGMAQLGKAMSFVLVLNASLASLLHPLLGALADMSGSFVVPFHLVGATLMLASGLLLLEPLARRLEDARLKKLAHEESPLEV